MSEQDIETEIANWPNQDVDGGYASADPGNEWPSEPVDGSSPKPGGKCGRMPIASRFQMRRVKRMKRWKAWNWWSGKGKIRMLVLECLFLPPGRNSIILINRIDICRDVF